MKSLIKDTQHGFRRGRSCLTNLLEFLDIAMNSFDEGKQLDVSYLDFSNAFDKVPHKRLVLQLNPRPFSVFRHLRQCRGGGRPLSRFKTRRRRA